MLTKRIIPCLDIKDRKTVKGVNFKNLRYAGDPVLLAEQYSRLGADELVFLDITATIEKRKTLVELVKDISKSLNIPFTVGGGIQSIEDVELLLENGADKISINSSAVKNPNLINQLSKKFGSQCITVAVDTKLINKKHTVHVQSGHIPTSLNTFEWTKEIVERGAGEILLTSMNHDGIKNGFAIELSDKITKSVSVPVIASGGAGSMSDFYELFKNNSADAALAASIFHFGEIDIPKLKKYLNKKDISIRLEN